MPHQRHQGAPTSEACHGAPSLANGLCRSHTTVLHNTSGVSEAAARQLPCDVGEISAHANTADALVLPTTSMR